ncbi:hypothetical protein SDC9_38340 [bioreactor metagenome]|jgi:hypothetical protein|uniref:Uncharacterized protein n=1 Tax=bioreactor metagenome TaxID=1076179 RepID=A0A644VP59_9ZZZZ|nr:hypothetical protein U5907_00615 [Bacteroidales bacterium MB20-C3-3]
MRTSKKMVLLWVAIALAAIIVLFVLFNWEAFLSGFDAGRTLAE